MSVHVPLDRIIDSPAQTRIIYDQAYIEDLGRDILRSGLLQPPAGRIVDDAGQMIGVDSFYTTSQSTFDLYLQENPAHQVQLAFGHNRLRAYRWLAGEEMPIAQRQKFSRIPMELRALSDEDLWDQAWAENEQRQDINAIERARAIQARMERFKLSQAEIALRYGKERPTIANWLRMLKLPEDLQQAVAAGQLSERQALELLPAVTLSEEDLAVFKRIQYPWRTPADIAKEALGGASSTSIRQQVKSLKDQIVRRREQDEREEEARRQAEAAMAKAKEEGTQLLKLSDLRGSQYDEVSDDPKSYRFVEGCSPECMCRAKALSHGGSVVDVCTNPSRRNSLKSKKTRDRKKERRAERVKRLEKLKQKLVRDGRVVWSPEAIGLLVKHVFKNHYIKLDDIRAAAKALGLPEVIAEVGGYSKSAEAEAALNGLDMDTALRFALQAIIQKDLREWIEFDGHKTEDFNQVMKGKPYPAPAPGGDGATALEQLELAPVPLSDGGAS